MFATYVHDLNPVLLRITDAIQLRWYGLAYLMGFVAGFSCCGIWRGAGCGC